MKKQNQLAVLILRALLLALCSLLLAPYSSLHAQQPGKVPRIGFQTDAPFSAIAARIEGFRQGLRELAYVEGKNMIIEWRSAEGHFERRNEIVADLVRLKPEVIVSAGALITRVLREATSTIPIVMGQDTDPVGSGVVA